MSNPIFDTHVHYNLESIWPDWQTHWRAAQAQGVNKSLVVGTTIETSLRALEIAHQEENVYAAVGIHPYELRKAIDNKLDVQVFLDTVTTQLTTLIAADSQQRIRALGETGLDYFRAPSDLSDSEAVKQAQQESLDLHLQLAAHYHLPVILHIRDTTAPETNTPGNAYWDALALVTQHRPEKCILHCASGPSTYIQTMVELGAYVSFAGNVTYPSANALRALMPLIPTDRLLLETDAPFLPPQGFRGKPCEPWMIIKTAEFVATQFNLDLDQIYQNSCQLFGPLA